MSRPKHITTVGYSSKAHALREWESGVGACEGQRNIAQGECLALVPPSEEVSARYLYSRPWAAYSYVECYLFVMLIQITI